MERDERYEVDLSGKIVVGIPETLSTSDRKDALEKMFSINGWTYTVVSEVSASHYIVELNNDNLEEKVRLHIYHGNVRKEDPERSREEKKIQLGTDNDPREHMDDGIILGFYSYGSTALKDLIIVAWPIEKEKNYPKNPSLRVNMKNDILPAKNTGYHADTVTGKRVICFRPEFIYHYLQEYKQVQYGENIYVQENDDNQEDFASDKKGCNVLYYGVPGAGKSHTIDKLIDKDRTERVVFHPDYSYSDFVGQILPRLVKSETYPEGKLQYVFEPGPFTKMMKKACNDSENNMYYLVIEEINRGNAPAIFGDIFQLLDREADGSGKYSISNYDMATEIYGDENHRIQIPANLTILATMNTSDQNVFTLDTAFQRRWEMHLIKNDVSKALHSGNAISGSTVEWGDFASVTNAAIIKFGEETGSSEDKRLGAYFAKEDELSRDKFPEKVLKYLWDDAFKMDRYVFFNDNVKSLDNIIEIFEEHTPTDSDVLKRILNYSVFAKMKKGNVETDTQITEDKTDDE